MDPYGLARDLSLILQTWSLRLLRSTGTLKKKTLKIHIQQPFGQVDLEDLFSNLNCDSRNRILSLNLKIQTCISLQDEVLNG